MLGVYIHVPFCLRRCNYCDFCSSVADGGRVEEYVSALVESIGKYAGKNLRADTVYLGGGTPSLLSGEQMKKILAAVYKTFDVSDAAEITAEANPGTVTPEKLRAYREAGVNRISFGIQSCKDNELYRLGRLHSFAEAEESVRTARLAGIKNVSADIMLGIPEQTPATLAETVERVAALGVDHISAYMLKIEEGTPFDCESVRRAVADDDTVADMYLMTVKMLSQRGFMQYEISNFAKPGFESRHNLKYWNCEEYLGFGPSAHSYFGGKRFYFPDDISGFINSPCAESRTEDASPNRLEEYIMLGLRLCKGILLDRVTALGGNAERLLGAAKPYVGAGLAAVSGKRLYLTPKGFLVSNGIIARLLESVL